MDDVDRTLREAHDRIMDRGWCQHQLEDDDGHICLYEAVCRSAEYVVGFDLAEKPHPELTDEWLALVRATGIRISKTINPRYRVDHTIDWNDTDGRTQNEVLDLLLRSTKEEADA